MKLLKVFNDVYLKILTILASSFNDPTFEPDRLLLVEVERIKQIKDANETTREIFEMVNGDVLPHIDDIFNHKPDVFINNKIGFLARFKFDAIWDAFQPIEEQRFWSSMVTLCRQCAVIRTCGGHLASLEEAGAKMMAQDGMTPEKAQKSIIQEAFSGGALSQQLMSSFDGSGGSISDMISNFSDVVRPAAGENGGAGNILKDFQQTSKLMSTLESLQKKVGSNESTSITDKNTADLLQQLPDLELFKNAGLD